MRLSDSADCIFIALICYFGWPCLLANWLGLDPDRFSATWGCIEMLTAWLWVPVALCLPVFLGVYVYSS